MITSLVRLSVGSVVSDIIQDLEVSASHAAVTEICVDPFLFPFDRKNVANHGVVWV